jgi:SmpA / OmlA family
MTWKRLGWLIGLPLTGVLALSLWLTLGESRPITEANSRRVQVGMTLGEVDTLLGPAHQRSRMPAGASSFICIYSEDDGSAAVPGDVIAVTFDDRGRVAKSEFLKKGPTAAPKRFGNRIREWLGL